MVSTTGTGTPVRPDHGDYLDVLMFLNAEAELADAWDLNGWLALLAPDVTYRMPVRTTRQHGDERRGYNLLDEDRAMLELRVRRYLDTESAWSENPWSRLRRFVTNIRVRHDDGELHARSNLLLLRSRSDSDQYEFVSAERNDLLIRTGDASLLLRHREITIDQSRLGMANLPFPL